MIVFNNIKVFLIYFSNELIKSQKKINISNIFLGNHFINKVKLSILKSFAK